MGNDIYPPAKECLRQHGVFFARHSARQITKHDLNYYSAGRITRSDTYKWVLENKCQPLIDIIRREAATKTVVLLDYETNSDVNDPKKPLSHASLIKAYCEGNYPI